MKKLAMGQVFILLTAVLAFSQTELFEQDLSGIHPYVGTKWNSKITQPFVGLEYTIEGRSTLGIRAGMPLKDTAFSAPPDSDKKVEAKFKSFFVNPYAVFEFIEPDNTNKFSLALRADYIYEKAPADSNLNSFSRNYFGMGPVFGFRFRAGDKFEITPKLAYEFFYTKWLLNWVTYSTTSSTTPEGHFEDDYFIQHDISVSADILYRLTETMGLNFEPKVVIKKGDGLRSTDLVNLDLHLGYVLAF
ncbi:MAG TPA: hypothetical protein DCQ83_01660 [Fibrobacteres bacterium]|jgi:hypothetical protein|nr:hypothetical protein [Fibrobacterota bacterium]